MIPPAVPEDDPQRVRLLHELRLLDTPAEESFDAATRLASRLTGCPIAGIVLLDAQRQWFKSLLGADVTETPREIALCAHAILSAEPTVVEDLPADPRFAGNPFVTQEPICASTRRYRWCSRAIVWGRCASWTPARAGSTERRWVP